VLFSGNSRNLCSLGDVSDLAPLLERSFLGSPPPRLFVGPAEHARSVREAFARHGALPLLDREQLYYVLTRDTLVPLDSVAIRPARADETEWVTMAQAAMTEEDLCVARSHIDMNRLRDISGRRIAAGKVWVVAEGSTSLQSGRVGPGRGRPLDRRRSPCRPTAGGLAARGIAAWASSVPGRPCRHRPPCEPGQSARHPRLSGWASAATPRCGHADLLAGSSRIFTHSESPGADVVYFRSAFSSNPRITL
jgi:hypothetical protein